jgi:hypothetical protein
VALPVGSLWVAPILEWYHGLLAALSEDEPARVGQEIMAASWRVRRTTGLHVTDHALDRFVERHLPGDRCVARAALLRTLSHAVPEDAAVPWARHGAEGWRAGALRLVVRNRRVVTVLPPTQA